MIFGLLPQTNALEKPIFSKYIARLNITSVWSKKWANECLRCSIRGFKGPDGEGDRWRASAHAPLRLDRCHFPAPPCPQPAAVRTSKLPSKERTHTHSGTQGQWGFEQEKRFPERFLKVELLKAWKPVPALKLNGLPLCYAWHGPEWHQRFKSPTKAAFKAVCFWKLIHSLCWYIDLIVWRLCVQLFSVFM